MFLGGSDVGMLASLLSRTLIFFFLFFPRCLTPPLALLQWSWKGGQSPTLSLSDWLASLSRTNWQTCYLCDCPPAVWIHIVLEVGLISGRKDAVCATSHKRLLHFLHSVEKKMSDVFEAANLLCNLRIATLIPYHNTHFSNISHNELFHREAFHGNFKWC